MQRSIFENIQLQGNVNDPTDRELPSGGKALKKFTQKGSLRIRNTAYFKKL